MNTKPHQTGSFTDDFDALMRSNSIAIIRFDAKKNHINKIKSSGTIGLILLEIHTAKGTWFVVFGFCICNGFSKKRREKKKILLAFSHFKLW